MDKNTSVFFGFKSHKMFNGEKYNPNTV